jgi:dihydrofolate reductase
MGQLIVSEFVTLDGVMQAPGGPEEDTESGFEHGGWQAPLIDAESGGLMTKDIQRMDALLLGRKTYDIFASYWPKATGDIADKLNNAPKFVASRSRRKLEWNKSTLIQGDLSKEVARIKQKHGEVHVIGSGDLVQTLLRHDLVDRLNLWVYPLLLGTGKRLFGEGTVPAGLRLAGSKAFPKGAIHLVYERAGKPKYGDMSVEVGRTTGG